MTSSYVEDTSRSWNVNRWDAGNVTLIGNTGTDATPVFVTVTGGPISLGSTATKITFPAIGSFPTFVGNVTYTVTAKANACVVGTGAAAKEYPCLQVGDAGYCKGPCESNVACNVFTASGDKSVGWEGVKCTGTPSGGGADGTLPVPGVCSEGPRSSSALPETAPATTGAGLLALVDTITNWFFAIFTVLTLIFILLAAFQFVTAGGDEAKLGEARAKLIWAAVGIIVALASKGLVPIIRSIVGG